MPIEERCEVPTGYITDLPVQLLRHPDTLLASPLDVQLDEKSTVPGLVSREIVSEAGNVIVVGNAEAEQAAETGDGAPQ